jgi:hypothetical protein
MQLTWDEGNCKLAVSWAVIFTSDDPQRSKVLLAAFKQNEKV